MSIVSVITPCYNSEKYIGDTIRSIQAQTFGDWEHIVVDDGSSDGSAAVVGELAKTEPRLKLVRQSNGGVSKARNVGFAHSNPDSHYVYFLDADDIALPTMLQTLVDYLEANPKVGLVYSTPRFIDGDGCFINQPPEKMGWGPRMVPQGWWLRPLADTEPDTPFLTLFTLLTLIPSVSLLRRDVYEATGGFDESFGHVNEDLDVFLRVALRSRIHRLTEPLVQYRHHANQSTASAERMVRQERKLYTKWDELLPTLPPDQQKVVRSARDFRNYRFQPWVGFWTARQKIRQRDWWGATRFAGGALRRYMQGFSVASRTRQAQS